MTDHTSRYPECGRRYHLRRFLIVGTRKLSGTGGLPTGSVQMASASVQHQLNLCPECDTSLGDGEMLQSHSPPLGCSQSRVEERSKVNKCALCSKCQRLSHQHGVLGGQCGPYGAPGVMKEAGKEPAKHWPTQGIWPG